MPAAHAGAVPVQVWSTTPDGSDKLTRIGDASFAAGTAPAAGALGIAVDATSRFQQVQGFGAAMTESSAHLIATLPAAVRTQLMTDLFDPNAGIGLSYLRQPIGSSDFAASAPFYSLDDNGTTADPGLSHFSVDRDSREILPMLRQAISVNRDIRVMGTPWSPPAWMKDSGSLSGGSLRPEYQDAYADYFVKFIQAYGQAGVTVTDVSPQNEPLFTTSYPSASMSPDQEASFIRVLDQHLTRAGLPTNILAYDHNWDRPDYPLNVFSQVGSIPRVIGAAFHCYAGDPEAQNQVIQAGKRVFFTECSGIDTGPTTFADTLKWQTEHLMIRAMRAGAETVMLWNLALDPNGGPTQSTCTNCRGVVTVSGGGYTRNAEYYVLGQVSRFVKRGAVRIGSTSGGPGAMQNVAFENPDGSRVLVVLNATSGAQQIAVNEGGESFGYTMPTGAVDTFVWPGTPTGGTGGGSGGGTALDRSGWTVSGSSSPSDPCCQGDVPSHAIDGNASTRWSTGTGQQPGQWFQVDLGKATTFAKLTLDSGASSGDYPRGYAVYASNDPSSWGTALATGTGTGSPVTVPLPTTTARYVRIVQTGQAGNWWSIHELNLYANAAC
ncbi:MAG: hypothetical protein AUG44_09475 [Actinobacteria bacterium 13_1_20CM_3_71_11]|nr:MAG: hypothetical protein AUG44_09475 [Actinobacteria bacterium 13_1_20CM_3_71_11]